MRIIRTAKKMGLETVAVFSEADRGALHVEMADFSECIGNSPVGQSYLVGPKILACAQRLGVDAIHPGYGLLSEDANFAESCESKNLVFIGPRPDQIRKFGLKHRARTLAEKSGVPLPPGSGLVKSWEEAIREAEKIGFPVMLKSTAGGGGIGMSLCSSSSELKGAMRQVRRMAQSNFGNDGLFLEKYFIEARHLEVQIFGDGQGGAFSLGVRDCSAQRRNQKVLEETPPMGVKKNVLEELEASAVALARGVRYRSAGTVEFIYDEIQEKFYFLEVNTRLQVEHGITELINGIDLVEWMIRLAYGDASMFEHPPCRPRGHSAEARIYAENPAKNFEPSTGLITRVAFPEKIRCDTWVQNGTEVSPYYDPLLAKIMVYGKNREQTIRSLARALSETEIHGIQTNLEYLEQVVENEWTGKTPFHTKSLQGFSTSSRTLEILRSGTQTTVQDFPGRLGYWDVGVPPSGPMDSLSFRMGNRIVGNQPYAKGLEITAYGPKIKFNHACVVALCGASGEARLNEQPVEFWQAIKVKIGDFLEVGRINPYGMRCYLLISGGLKIPEYLGSGSTFTLGKFGGHCGRALVTGDHLPIGDDSFTDLYPSIDPGIIPKIYKEWSIRVLYGPHGAPDYFTEHYLEAFFESKWKVHYNSDRTGVRLEGPKPEWARKDGGEAGLHPSNIHDNAYSVGAVDFTGDMPVILGPDGPSLGGFVCPVTVVAADLWKIGQLKPGDLLQFSLISHEQSTQLMQEQEKRIEEFERIGMNTASFPMIYPTQQSCILATGKNKIEKWMIRQAGDSNLLVEFGEPILDLGLRFKIHLLHQVLQRKKIAGVVDLTPGIRSLQVHFNPLVAPRKQLLDWITEAIEGLELESKRSVASRIVSLPISWDDPTTRLATEKYRQSVRPDAPWCPDNIEFIRRINGLSSIEEVRKIIFEARYVVLGLGDVYLGAPVATPMDPRHRLVTTKYNPARTWTPENAVGIGGAYLCIYGMEGPGGYQLFGRTLQMWNTYGGSDDFSDGQPWLLRFFDQIRFYEVSSSELEEIRRDFPLGRFSLRTEDSTFDLEKYQRFLDDHTNEISIFQKKQKQAFREERERWKSEDRSIIIKPKDSKQENSDVPPEGTTSVESMVAGNLWKWEVSEGDRVEHGQGLGIIESMKMEIALESPGPGKVRSILKQEGELVRPGECLLLLED